ncbi:putative phosphate-binding protein [Magnetofaba australis IT-1]|uniref:Putative phosphate-binding protein n=2 Tax=Magnetofaba TaxID=1472292 RepID=A0A1Y2K8A4_9PROT|nr:putative phosphate-binding protein [Magnetofaba australis IT-1]
MVGAVLLLSAPHIANAAPAAIRLKGSEILFEVALLWSRAYQVSVANNSGVSVEVQGGGSGNGIAALINGHVEVASTSRPMKSREISLTNRRLHRSPVGYIVGWDALSVIVHPDNPLTGISLAQLEEIFGKEGRQIHWSDLGVEAPGCEGGRVRPVTRKNTAGEFVFFRRSLFENKRHMRRDLRYFKTPEEVVSSVANDPCAIGYAGMAHATSRVKRLCLDPWRGEQFAARESETGAALQDTNARAATRKADADRCISPTADNLRRQTYPLVRPLYMYMLSDPEPAVSEFIAWARGPEGQSILERYGLIPIGHGGAPIPANGAERSANDD